ncbi:MAG TPA: SRPBCC family protein [Gaiellaceae bacterium]|nr:SRPBCC family protein [Gaiellaceae bacterium]
MARENGKSAVKEKVEDVAGNGSKSKEALTAAAVSAVGALAAAKGPDLIRKVVGATEEKGENEAAEMGEKAVEGAKKGLGNAGPGGKIASKLLGGGKGGGSGSGGKKTRRLPIQRWTDVALPIDRVYDEFTKFDQFPNFMHRVLNVEQKGPDKISWSEKIWFSSRQWEGRVTERRKNDRIVWTTKGGMQHKGIVSFHKLSDNLTRVMVDMEFEPNGMMEKMASGLRFVKRAVQADLARFKTYVEMQDAKGIDYRPNPEDEKDDQDDENGGDADEPTSRDQKSDEEREKDRKEREKAREERRKSGSRS